MTTTNPNNDLNSQPNRADIVSKAKARLGAIAPSTLNGLPKAVQRLIENDLPKLIELVEKN